MWISVPKLYETKLTELKVEIDCSTIIAEDFKTHFQYLIKQLKYQQRNRSIEQYYIPVRPNGYL